MVGGMDLHHLRAFVAVAEELSFRRAAERLHLSRPPLTRQIQALERELGVILLMRDGRRAVRLTDAGHAFLARTRQALQSVTEAREHAHLAAKGKGGELRLAGCEVHSPTVLSACLPEFRRRYPDVQITFQGMMAAEQLTALHQGAIHLSFSADFGESLGPAFVARTLFTIPLNVALPAGHPLARRRGGQVDLPALSQEVFLSPTSSDALAYTRRLDEVWERTVNAPRKVRVTDGRENVLALVAAGYGVAILSDLAGSTTPGCRTKRLRSSMGTYQLRAIWLRENPSRTLGHFLAVVETLLRHDVPSFVPEHRPPTSPARTHS